MPDRLDELRQQRALVQQHLTWLDHEIANITVSRLTLPPFAMRPSQPGTASRPPTPAPVAVPELSQFQVDPDNVQVDTRRGCILYSAVAILVLVVVLVAIYFLGYRDHPVLLGPETGPTVVYPAGSPKAPAKRPATPAPGKTPPPAK